MSTKPITGAFGATAASAALKVNRGYFNVSLSGTWAGTVKLQRSFDAGSTWLVVSSHTADVESVVHQPETDVQYRFECTAYTSGSCVYRISQ